MPGWTLAWKSMQQIRPWSIENANNHDYIIIILMIIIIIIVVIMIIIVITIIIDRYREGARVGKHEF